jgi:hypothetical protein
MTLRLPPGVSLGSILAGGAIADSSWTGGSTADDWEPVSFTPKTANGKIRIRIADLVKVGAEGYIHGYICVRPPCGEKYKEAEFNGKLGEVRHDGVRIGKMRKNDDGTYSMAHLGDAGRVKLTAKYATRADAAKSIALYHNVDKLHGQAVRQAEKEPIEKARDALAAGDADSAAMFLAQAEVTANQDGDRKLASHLVNTRAAIVDGPKAVNPPHVGGLTFNPGEKPAPGAPMAHAPLPEDVKNKARQHLDIIAMNHHSQQLDDYLASARTAIDAGNGDLALQHLKDANAAAIADNEQRDTIAHIRIAHDVVATHLGEPLLPLGKQPAPPKVKPPAAVPGPKTIAQADERAKATGFAMRELMTTRAEWGMPERLRYLSSDDAIASNLRHGNAGKVLRDLREVDLRARSEQGQQWGQNKTAIAEARKELKASYRDLEKLHKQDVSKQTLSERAHKLADDANLAGAGRWYGASAHQAAAALDAGDLGTALKHLRNAQNDALGPKLNADYQFAKDFGDLADAVQKEHEARLAAGLSAPEAVPGSELGAGTLGAVRAERAEVNGKLIAGIKSGVKVKKAPTVTGIMGETSLVTFNDGSQWVHKTPIFGGEVESDHEEAASLAAQALGVRAPTVIRDPLDHKSVYMTLVNGNTALETHDTANALMLQASGRSAEAADMMRRIGFLDKIIQNHDRHRGNFMMDQDGMPNAIDHGMAFSTWAKNGSGVTGLMDKSDLSQEYYAQSRQNLQDLEPEIEKIPGGSDYYAQMMSQFDDWMSKP